MTEPVIIDELGLIYGRDAIFLDKIEFESTRSVKLIGELTGSLCKNVANPENKDISYELTFTGILSFSMVELDFYDHSRYTSSFEKVIHSDRIARFKNAHDGDIKVKETHEHYIFHTYDDVIEVIASEFELKLDL